MLNRVVLIGRLTRDPELRYTPSGVAVASFTIAVDRRFTNQQGERETDFIPIVTWRQLAENCANYLKKGRLVGVDGRLQVRSYENNEGRRVWVTEVVADDVRFLEPAGGASRNPGMEGDSQRFSPKSNNDFDDPFADDGKPIDISDDDLPF
ncbi:single-stranded DNA-binding protein A [Polycladomyces abyssicola]|jgi:single-strand DNA-binding protein|uniref:Single-stranded DNA-binding protein n=1 Tax=Polycladomyces abyssicola TaxID=1125966 RepID=A0A8D5UJP1_9BACL|nr:single-stranded DNA-binding protein [Polycladomyces abyssicola]BCU83394.1 single-stranded DNA-binding protein A [Polycladomyces abyssicola]